jgi:beta-glucanase (GH16 family)
MRLSAMMVGCSLVAMAWIPGCGSGGSSSTTPPPPPQTQVATPAISLKAAQAGAQIASLSTTTAGATIYYTIDGTTPTTASPVYLAPVLIASNVTLSAYATASGDKDSAVFTQSFSPNIASGTLVWSDEFTNTTGSNQQPDPTVWGYDTGTNCCGNNELETYCAWGNATAPCDTGNPNAYVGTDNMLHIVALNPSGTVYTSARLKSEGLFSFNYGRIEAKMMLPESQGMWPAFWMLGNNITKISWPACGELDIMEHIDGNDTAFGGGGSTGGPGYDWMQSSIHGTNLNGGQPYTTTGFSAAAWHTYGMIWSKGQVQYYIDDPTNIYETFTPSTQGGTWPFDSGPQFVLLNLAVGGSWPGSPDSTTVFPGNMVVDYVRIYAN